MGQCVLFQLKETLGLMRLNELNCFISWFVLNPNNKENKLNFTSSNLLSLEKSRDIRNQMFAARLEDKVNLFLVQ